MKVTEQIDALVTLSTNPLKYLAVPRVVAATLAMPVLVAVGDAIGIMGGWLVGVTRLDFNSATYLKNTVDFLEAWDVGSGLVKGAVFGFIVALMGCYHGMNSARGAQGVGGRRRRRWCRLGADPGGELRPDRDLLHLMIELRGVHKAFGANRVLQGVDLSIAPGTVDGDHRRVGNGEVGAA